MRMRRKRHLDERAAACSPVLLGTLRGDYPVNGGAPEERSAVLPDTRELLDFREVFGNNNPVWLEIGCGKGIFSQLTAERYPGINLIALEQSLNVLVTAMERTVKAGTKNLKYLCGNAEYLEKLIPKASIDKIYLNFSCPFPKKSYAKHRLTHPKFLEIYKKILKDGGIISQKTDDPRLFEFSLNSYSQCGFMLRNITLDLHNSEIEGNIITEYEQRFSSQGLPIYYAEAVNKKYI